MEIYTDGSFSPKPEYPYNAGAGWGVVVVKKIGKAVIVSKYGGGRKGANTQDMEHTAMFEAIKYFLRSSTEKCTIVSDSQYMIKSLAGTFIEIDGVTLISKEYSKITEIDGWIRGWFPDGKNKARWELWLEVYGTLKKIFSSGKTLTFKWVKAHNGTRYNEMVDVVAKTNRL